MLDALNILTTANVVIICVSASFLPMHDRAPIAKGIEAYGFRTALYDPLAD